MKWKFKPLYKQWLLQFSAKSKNSWKVSIKNTEPQIKITLMTLAASMNEEKDGDGIKKAYSHFCSGKVVYWHVNWNIHRLSLNVDYRSS